MPSYPMLAAAALLVAHADTAPASDTHVRRYEGVARSADGSVVYRETHWVIGEDDRRELLVLFRCPDGRAFARKHVREAGTPQAVLFSLEDARSGRREGVREVGAGREVYMQPDADAAEKTVALQPAAQLVIDAGIDSFIHAHWDALASGEAQTMQFLVPDRLRSYPFRLVRVVDATSDPTLLRLRLEMNAWYAFVVPTIDFFYDGETRELREYAGIANVRDENGGTLKVQIRFPAENRVGASALEREEALAAPLDGRCRL